MVIILLASKKPTTVSMTNPVYFNHWYGGMDKNLSVSGATKDVIKAGAVGLQKKQTSKHKLKRVRFWLDLFALYLIKKCQEKHKKELYNDSVRM